MTTCVCVCVCVCSRFLIARQKLLYLCALRDGEEGGRGEAAFHTQNIERKTPMCVCVCVCVTCSRFLIVKQKIVYLCALRDGEEGGRVDAATHTVCVERKMCVCVCVCVRRVCVCVTCSRFLIARQKILYLSALRDGKEGGRVEAATHTQNIERKTHMTVCVCVCVCV